MVENLIENFVNLGLSHYESQVLISIYSLGQVKATEASKHSKVPQAKIYAVLDSLCNKRLIKMHATKPLTYSPIQPEKLFELLNSWEKSKFDIKREKIHDNKKLTMGGLKSLYKKSKSTKPVQELVEIIKLGDPSHFETKQIINSAKKELYFLTESFEFLPLVEKELNNAINKKINIKIVLSSEKNIKPNQIIKYKSIVKKLKVKNVKIKFSDELFNIRYVLSDPIDKTSCGCMLVVKEYDVPKDMRNSIFSKNQSFVKGIKNHFNYFWQKSNY